MGSKILNKLRKKSFIDFVIIVYVLISVKSFVGQTLQKKELLVEKEKEELQVKKLENQVVDLKDEINKKDTMEFVEKVAREDYKMMKPREIVYIDKNKSKNKNYFIKNSEN